jgi:hypothetical protein
LSTAFKTAGEKAIRTNTLKFGAGIPLVLTTTKTDATGSEKETKTQTDSTPTSTQATRPTYVAPKPPKNKQVEFEGQLWDENLVKQIQQHRQRQATGQATPAPMSLKTRVRTPPRKPSGEVDIEAWHVMTGQKVPKTYDETKRAIEVTKPYGYSPTEVDPSLKSRYEKVQQQVQKHI